MTTLFSLFKIYRWNWGRRATEKNLEDFNNLIRQLKLDDTSTEPLQGKTMDDFQNFMGVLQHSFIVAEDPATGRIVGMASLHWKPLLAHGLIGEVEEFVVDKDWRGTGLADMLDEELRAVAREFGICEIRLTSNPLRVDANKFYKRRGYKLYDTNNYRLRLPI